MKETNSNKVNSSHEIWNEVNNTLQLHVMDFEVKEEEDLQEEVEYHQHATTT